jgi:hypothetical protein
MKFRNTLLLYTILFSSCNSTGIENMNTSIIKYDNLPNEVKKVMFENDYIEEDGNINLKLFTELNEPSNYEYVSKQHWLMSWVYEGEIVRKLDEKRFKLDFNTEHRSKYVILNDYLYVPRHYNIYMKDSLKYSFSRFKLD